MIPADQICLAPIFIHFSFHPQNACCRSTTLLHSYQNRARCQSTAYLYDQQNARCRSTTLLEATKTARAVEVRRRFTGVWAHFECRDSRYRYVKFTLHIVRVQCCLQMRARFQRRTLPCIYKNFKKIRPSNHTHFCALCYDDDDDLAKAMWFLQCRNSRYRQVGHIHPTHTHSTSSSHSKNPFLPVN